MRNRRQRRHKAILPIRIISTTDGTTSVAHTTDISASGARIVVTSGLTEGSSVTVEFKHRRTAARVVWCKPVKDRGFDHEAGLQLVNAGTTFWGVNLPLCEEDEELLETGSMPFERVMSLIGKRV